SNPPPPPPPPPPSQNSLSGQVFNDLNGDGNKDAGEGGLPGFTIHLYNSANFNGGAFFPVFMTALTDGSGNYSFSGLADGTYSIGRVHKAGWQQTTSDIASVSVSGGAGHTGLDFGDEMKGKHNGDNGNDHGKKCDNRGLHLGWFIGKGNQGKHKHCDGEDNA